MRRVAITGMGIICSIGNTPDEVEANLRAAKPGITHADVYAEMGFRSCVHGEPKIDMSELIERKAGRFLSPGTRWNYVAMQRAIEDSGLEEADVQNPKSGLVMGSGGPSLTTVMEAIDTARNKGVRKVSPFAVPKCMSSTNSATLATPFGIKGVNYSISSACSTSAHCIGHGAELIQLGKQDIVFAGGGEELDWSFSVLFDAMQAMSSKYNDTPEKASRAFDAGRDGFVIAGGGGVVVLEEMEHAQKRGAKIYAELTGYGATSDGADMVQPSGEGSVRCMQNALEEHKKLNGSAISYINPHATSTPIGDEREVEAISKVFGSDMPPISATKSLTGHALGAAGVHEAIYSLIMLHKNFMCESANIENLDEKFESVPILRETREQQNLQSVLSNSFGFGGTNATLIFSRVD